jgi:hypothetical protein
MTEVWAWNRAEAGLVGHRSASPRDDDPRRPSHTDKQRVWRRELLAAEVRAALCPGVTERAIAAVAEQLLNLAIPVQKLCPAEVLTWSTARADRTIPAVIGWSVSPVR